MNKSVMGRMESLGGSLSHGSSKVLGDCYARLTPSADHLRVDKSGRTHFVSKRDFEELSDELIVSDIEAYFDR